MGFYWDSFRNLKSAECISASPFFSLIDKNVLLYVVVYQKV